jgi:hypothetical protein
MSVLAFADARIETAANFCQASTTRPTDHLPHNWPGSAAATIPPQVNSEVMMRIISIGPVLLALLGLAWNAASMDIGGWHDGRATFYGTDAWSIHKGADSAVPVLASRVQI